MSDCSRENMGDKKDKQGPIYDRKIVAAWKKVMMRVCPDTIEMMVVGDPSNSHSLESSKNHGSENAKMNVIENPLYDSGGDEDSSTIEPFCRLYEINAFRGLLKRIRLCPDEDYHGMLIDFLAKPSSPEIRIFTTDKTIYTNNSEETEELKKLRDEIDRHNSVFETRHGGHGANLECNCVQQMRDLKSVRSVVIAELNRNSKAETLI